MRSRSDIAFKDIDDKWSLKPEYILYLDHFDGFTWRLWNYDMVIDSQFRYSIVFGSFELSIAKQQVRTFVELEGVIPENLVAAINTFRESNVQPIIRTPDPGIYQAEDGSSDSYLIATINGTLNGDFTSVVNNEMQFVNDTERRLYALHTILRNWLEVVLSEAETQENLPNS